MPPIFNRLFCRLPDAVKVSQDIESIAIPGEQAPAGQVRKPAGHGPPRRYDPDLKGDVMQVFAVRGELPSGLADKGFGPSRLEARRSSRRDLMAVTDRLIAEFAGALPPGTVMRHVCRAREHLLATGVRAGLAIAAETMARTRLRTLLSAHGAAE